MTQAPPQSLFDLLRREGLRRILGHISNEVLSTYVHLSQAALAERMGTFTLSGGWLQSR